MCKGRKDKQKKMILLLRRIPFFGILFVIANHYANSGLLSERNTIAKFSLWNSRIGVEFFIIFVLSLFIVTFFQDGLYNAHVNSNGLDPASVSLAIFPSILGFGIGVFVVVFALPNEFISRLNKSEGVGSKKNFGAAMLVVDMAYPLIIYCAVLFGSFLLKLFPIGFITQLISIFLLLYGMFMTFELVGVVFSTAYAMLAINALSQKK